MAWRMNAVDWVAMGLGIIGALIWLGLGILGTNALDTFLSTGGAAAIALRVFYVIVGLAGLWLIYTGYKLATTPLTYGRPGTAPAVSGTEAPSA